MDVMQHWNLLYLNCLGFFSDPGYLLLSLLPVPCLEKGRFGRSVCGDRRKEPSPGRAYRSQFEEKRQRTFRPCGAERLSGASSSWILLAAGTRSLIFFRWQISISLNSGPTIDNLLELPLVGSLTSVRLSWSFVPIVWIVFQNHSDHLKNHLDDPGKTVRNRAVFKPKIRKASKAYVRKMALSLYQK